MVPRNLFRPIVLGFSLALLAFGSIIPARTENAPVPQGANHIFTKAFCSSQQDKPVVYFSKIFDVDITVPTIDTQPLVNGFTIHLKEKYDYQDSSNYGVVCPLYKTLGEAEASKRKMQAQVQPTAKQIVEVDWTPPAWAQPLQAVGGPGFFPQTPPWPTHTFCAVGHDDTMYFSDVFDTLSTQNYQAFGHAFNDSLRKQYGFEPQVDATCAPLNTVREAERNLNARLGGVRANKHKAVETGWKFGPNAVASTRPRPRPTPKDDGDPEPAPRPVIPTAAPSQSINEFATKEGPLVLDYCRKDPLLSQLFDCYRVQRSVYNYRLEHGSSEPLASLFTQEKVNLAEAIGTGLGLWVRARATAQQFSTKVTNCIEQKFVVSFYDKPYISRMQEIYTASVAACK
jgi:hypothetical protein